MAELHPELAKVKAQTARQFLAGCIEDHPPIASGWYFWNGCMFDKAANPTHWMQMPNHPKWPADGWQARRQAAPKEKS